MQRLFATQLYAPSGPKVDEAGRVRLDDLEMKPEIQSAVAKIWPRASRRRTTAAQDRHRGLP